MEGPVGYAREFVVVGESASPFRVAGATGEFLIVDAAPVLLPGVSGRIDGARADRDALVAQFRSWLVGADSLVVIAESGGLSLRRSGARLAEPVSLIFDDWVAQSFAPIYGALGVFAAPGELTAQAPTQDPIEDQPEILAASLQTSVGHEVVRFLASRAASPVTAGIPVQIVTIAGELDAGERELLSDLASSAARVLIATGRRGVDGDLPDSLAGDRLDAQREIDHIVENQCAAVGR
ncbi:hypothetical protein [Timonella senegalensis]|uniref:hypothetical protein n=1 Tax=Timonella senegalensis TaxID=1465825 RepID=UPI0005929255|nr:hypothetical protein [Timonella senegalensis]